MKRAWTLVAALGIAWWFLVVALVSLAFAELAGQAVLSNRLAIFASGVVVGVWAESRAVIRARRGDAARTRG